MRPFFCNRLFLISSISLALLLFQGIIAPTRAELNKILTLWAGIDHEVAADSANAMFKRLGAKNGFEVVISKNKAILSSPDLLKYDVICLVNCKYMEIKAGEDAAFQKYIRNGGGCLVIHSTMTTEWQYLPKLAGAKSDGHPANQAADLFIDSKAPQQHTILQGLPPRYKIMEEWLNMDPNPAQQSYCTILMLVDEKSYTGGKMGASHPIVWTSSYDGGRTSCILIGHIPQTYSDTVVSRIALNCLKWSAGDKSALSHPATGNNKFESFKMYPNPVSSVLNIELNNGKETNIMIYNLKGMLVKSLSIKASTAINVSDLTNGMYTIKFSSSNGTGFLISEQKNVYIFNR